MRQRDLWYCSNQCMANGNGAGEGLEHARAVAFRATAFRDKEGGRRRTQKPQPYLYQAGGGAATIVANDAHGSVDQARAIGLEAPTASVLSSKESLL